MLENMSIDQKDKFYRSIVGYFRKQFYSPVVPAAFREVHSNAFIPQNI
jgi:hypothetical protein